MKQLQTLKNDLNQSRVVSEELEEDIQDGEVLLQIEKFSFTSNNVTYGATGAKAYFENILVDGKLKRDYSPVRNEKVRNTN